MNHPLEIEESIFSELHKKYRLSDDDFNDFSEEILTETIPTPVACGPFTCSGTCAGGCYGSCSGDCSGSHR